MLKGLHDPVTVTSKVINLFKVEPGIDKIFILIISFYMFNSRILKYTGTSSEIGKVGKRLKLYRNKRQKSLKKRNYYVSMT